MAGSNENVAIFNPLVLSLPNWHPDGPDGRIDGFVIPFVMPDDELTGGKPNRGARIRIAPTPFGFRATLEGCSDYAETVAQARALAGAWVRAAEVLENAIRPEPEPIPTVDDHVVDCEIVEDEDVAEPVLPTEQRVRVLVGDEAGRCGRIIETHLSAGDPIRYSVLLDADGDLWPVTLRFDSTDVEPVE